MSGTSLMSKAQQSPTGKGIWRVFNSLKSKRSATALLGAFALAAGIVTAQSGVAQEKYRFEIIDGVTYAFPADGSSNEPIGIVAERYQPTIWVDPDGCEHWVMDDGWEGFMTPHVLPNGKPVCPHHKH